MENNTVSIIIIAVCIILSGYFSATETAFSSLNVIRMKNMAEKGDKKASLVLNLLENFDSLLSTILVGNNIVNIFCASVATLLFVRLIGEDTGASMSTAVTTILVLIFGEVSPKSIAKESPEKFAMFSAPIIRVLYIVLTPVNFLFRQWKKLLSRLFRSEKGTSITGEELMTIVETAEQEGGINEQEGAIIRNAIDFSDLEAMDVFTPRVDVAGIPAESSKEEIARIFRETGYSRLPVYEDTLDNIVGIINQKDFYNFAYDSEQDIRSIIQKPLFIARQKRVGSLLKEFQQQQNHFAVVIDEFGGTLGILTLEDILEELVGEIWDENETAVTEIDRISEREYLVLGDTNVEKLFEQLDREQEFETTSVSGWVMGELGRIPKAEDTFEYQGLEVTVLTMAGKRVGKVRIRILPEDGQEE